MKLFKELRKLRDDTLKGPNRKYSRKSLTVFTWVSLSVVTGLYIVWNIPTQAINVFFGYLGLAGGVLGATIVDKLKNGDSTYRNEVEAKDKDEEELK
tara:strand:- start:2331 stop:2621 length:291 start_codon:yes stop_codon:yes gene_type:complete